MKKILVMLVCLAMTVGFVYAQEDVTEEVAALYQKLRDLAFIAGAAVE